MELGIIRVLTGKNLLKDYGHCIPAQLPSNPVNDGSFMPLLIFVFVGVWTASAGVGAAVFNATGHPPVFLAVPGFMIFSMSYRAIMRRYWMSGRIPMIQIYPGYEWANKQANENLASHYFVHHSVVILFKSLIGWVPIYLLVSNATLYDGFIRVISHPASVIIIYGLILFLIVRRIFRMLGDLYRWVFRRS